MSKNPLTTTDKSQCINRPICYCTTHGFGNDYTLKKKKNRNNELLKKKY